jgi:hypothetical protein
VIAVPSLSRSSANVRRPCGSARGSRPDRQAERRLRELGVDRGLIAAALAALEEEGPSGITRVSRRARLSDAGCGVQRVAMPAQLT